MRSCSFGQLGTSKDTSITDKPIGRLGKRRWVEPWYLSYAILGCTMGGMFPILIPLLALKRFSSACHVGLIMAAFNLGGLMAPIWGSVADRYRIHRVLLCSSLIIVAISLAALSFTNIFCAVLATACVTGSAVGGWLAAQWGYTATVGMAVVTEASGLILMQKISANRF